MSRIAIMLVIALCCAAAHVRADTNPPTIETSKQFGARTVYYNVFPSTDLLPEVAARYQIIRADDRVVMNIALRNNSTGTSLPEAAQVTGTYSDLMQNKTLEFQEIREPGAVYYIAQLRITNRELLRFDINVLPLAAVANDATPIRPLPVTFTRRFAVDN
jgi:hypothetical protein